MKYWGPLVAAQGLLKDAQDPPWLLKDAENPPEPGQEPPFWAKSPFVAIAPASFCMLVISKDRGSEKHRSGTLFKMPFAWKY